MIVKLGKEKKSEFFVKNFYLLSKGALPRLKSEFQHIFFQSYISNGTVNLI